MAVVYILNVLVEHGSRVPDNVTVRSFEDEAGVKAHIESSTGVPADGTAEWQAWNITDEGRTLNYIVRDAEGREYARVAAWRAEA